MGGRHGARVGRCHSCFVAQLGEGGPAESLERMKGPMAAALSLPKMGAVGGGPRSLAVCQVGD